jgi:DNA-binding response OmpR family regulator
VYTPQTIVLYGHDELLLMTRRRILEFAGFRASVTSDVKEIPRLVRELSADLVVLCHSLSRTECVLAGLIAKNHRAELRTLLMVTDGSIGELDCGMSEVADEIFNLSLEPEKLVAKVRSMLAYRPQSTLMHFPEVALSLRGPLARTS